MKIIKGLAAGIFASLATIIFSLNVLQTSDGPHKGRVKSSGEYKIETKISPNFVYAFLLDKTNKPISNEGLICEIKFLFHEKNSAYFILKRYHEDGFICHTNLTGYHSYQVIFHILGKRVSAIFETKNTDSITKKQS